MHMQRQMDVGRRRSNAAERAEMDAAGERAIQRSDGRVVHPYKKNLSINGTVGAARPYSTVLYYTRAACTHAVSVSFGFVPGIN
jgi:hypothetical protein